MRRIYRQLNIVLAAAVIAPLLVIQPSIPAVAKESTQTKIDAAKKEAEEAKEDVEDQQDKIDDLKERKNAVKITLEELTDDLTGITSDIAELDGEIAEKEADIDEIEAELAPLEDDLEKAEADLKEATKDRNDQYEAMKKRIQYMYEHGDDTLLDVISKSASYSDLLNKQDYIQKLSEYDRTALTKYEKTAASVEKYEKAVEERRDKVKVRKEAAEKEKEELETLKGKQEEKQWELEDLIDTYAGNVEMTEKEIAAAQEKADELQKELNKKNAEVSTLQAQLKKEREMTKAASSGTWTKASAYNGTTSDRYLMANIIFCEAGNQPYEGQVAVGAVIMNRVRSSVCPNTISGVVYQKGQFEPVSTGRLALALARNEATDSCYKAADAAMAGENPIGNCLFFRTPIAGINYKYKIAGHIFY